jgi:hypothetical protein
MTEALSQGLEVTQMTDAMFDHNPMLSKRCVLGFLPEDVACYEASAWVGRPRL